MMKNKILVITGMHRSGTSMITQWLNKCGLDIGDRLLGALVGNEEGHFEDLDFVEFHTSVLEHHHTEGNGLTETVVKQIDETSGKELAHIISAKNALHAEWGWKDPRTCLFLSVYREVLPDALYLIIIRDYASVVNSLISRIYRSAEKKYVTRSWFAGFLWKTFRRHIRKRKLYRSLTEHYLKVCITYNEQILHHTTHLAKDRYIVVDYKKLASGDKPVFSHLRDVWKFSLHYTGFNTIYKEKLLNAPVDLFPYVKDKSLFAKAEKLEMSLRSLIPATVS